MKIIQLTQGKEALCDDQDFDWLNQWSWYAHLSVRNYYAAKNSSRNQDGKQVPIFMHNVIAEKMGLIGPIDHKDQNSLNNQHYNLRVATRSQNQANRGTQTNNTSGFEGVTWDRRKQKWRAKIQFQKHAHNLGCFDCPIKAAEAYDRAAIRLFGEFAVLNFPS